MHYIYVIFVFLFSFSMYSMETSYKSIKKNTSKEDEKELATYGLFYLLENEKYEKFNDCLSAKIGIDINLIEDKEGDTIFMRALKQYYKSLKKKGAREQIEAFNCIKNLINQNGGEIDFVVKNKKEESILKLVEKCKNAEPHKKSLKNVMASEESSKKKEVDNNNKDSSNNSSNSKSNIKEKRLSLTLSAPVINSKGNLEKEKKENNPKIPKVRSTGSIREKGKFEITLEIDKSEKKPKIKNIKDLRDQHRKNMEILERMIKEASSCDELIRQCNEQLKQLDVYRYQKQ